MPQIPKPTPEQAKYISELFKKTEELVKKDPYEALKYLNSQKKKLLNEQNHSK